LPIFEVLEGYAVLCQCGFEELERYLRITRIGRLKRCGVRVWDILSYLQCPVCLSFWHLLYPIDVISIPLLWGAE